MFKLRPYQEGGVGAGTDYFEGKSKNPSVVVAPTAAGKSLIIGSIASKLVDPTVVFQPSKELLEQNYEKLLGFGGEASIYSASVGKKEIGDITYATIGSVKNIASEFKKRGVKNVIIDECHSVNPEKTTMYMKFFKELGVKKVLGLTATPIRLKTFGERFKDPYSQLCFQTRTRPKFFKDIIHVTQVQELVQQGFWSKLKYERYDFDDSTLILNSTGAEYTEASISRAIEEQGINNHIYKRLKSLMKTRKKIIVFMDSVANAKKMAGLFGDKADYVCGKTPKKEREKIVKDFKEGDLQIITNFTALGIGFDAPEIDCVVMGRPTNSFVFYYQFLGRGTRIHDNKKDCLILDYGNNVKRFGGIETIHYENFEGHGWGLFNEGRLLSGIPMDLPEPMTMEKITFLANKDKVDGVDPVIWFGKHKDKKVSQLPVPYMLWIGGDDYDATSPKARTLKSAVKARLDSLVVQK